MSGVTSVDSPEKKKGHHNSTQKYVLSIDSDTGIKLLDIEAWLRDEKLLHVRHDFLF